MVSRVEYSRLEQRWFATILLYTAAPILAVALYRAPPGVDFWWDTLMALGVLAAGGLALLPLLSARWWAPQQRVTPFLRLIQAVHRHVSYVAVGLVALHVVGLVILEGRVVEYLKLAATAPMLAGLVSSVLFLLLILSSKFREELAWTYRSWRHWHAGLSMLALACMIWHVFGAGYYFPSASKLGSLVWLVVLPTVCSVILRRRPLRQVESTVQFTLAAGAHAAVEVRSRRLAVAIALTWLAASMLYARIHIPEPPQHTESPCVIEPCL